MSWAVGAISRWAHGKVQTSKKSALSRELRLKMLSGIGCFAYRSRHPGRHARRASREDPPLVWLEREKVARVAS